MDPKSISSRRRKWDKFLSKVGDWKNNSLAGAKMGFIVGALSGVVLGLMAAFQTKRMLAIPITMLGSACTFSCIMALGSVVRSD
jgi:hypothetical protein